MAEFRLNPGDGCGVRLGVVSPRRVGFGFILRCLNPRMPSCFVKWCAMKPPMSRFTCFMVGVSGRMVLSGRAWLLPRAIRRRPGWIYVGFLNR